MFTDISGTDKVKIKEYSQNFILKQNKTKTFYIVIEDANIGADTSGKIKLIYTLSY